MIDISLNIKNDVDEIIRDLDRVEKTVVPRATADTLNKLIVKANNDVKRKVIAETGLPAKRFKSRFKAFKTNPKILAVKSWVGLKFGAALKQKSLSGKTKALAKRGVNVLSKPFDATMKSGKSGQFVRVDKTGSRKGSRGRSPGRSTKASKNLPIINIDQAKVFLPENTESIQRASIAKIFDREFVPLLLKQLNFRLKQKGSR